MENSIDQLMIWNSETITGKIKETAINNALFFRSDHMKDKSWDGVPSCFQTNSNDSDLELL